MTSKQRITVGKYSPTRRGALVRIDVEFVGRSKNGVDTVLQALWMASVKPDRADLGTWPPSVTGQSHLDAYAGLVTAASELVRALERANDAGMGEGEISELTATVRRALNEIAD